MDEMTIYWITRFDGFIVLFVICMFLSFISIALGIVTWVDSKEHYEEGGVALGKRIVKIASPLSVLFALVHTYNEGNDCDKGHSRSCGCGEKPQHWRKGRAGMQRPCKDNRGQGKRLGVNDTKRADEKSARFHLTSPEDMV